MAHRVFRQFFFLVTAGLLLVSGTANAEDGRGMLKVTTDKGTATVYLGIEEIGETPISQYLEAGTYTIRVLKDEFEPFVRKIHIRPSQATTVSARLYPGTGSVEFLVEPSGAELTLNAGKETWSTPVRLKDLKERKYSYTITAPGHENETGTFSFKKGQNLLLTARLQSSAGLLSVLSRPRGAFVILDGKPAGQTPLALEEVESGIHTIQIKKKGYASVFRRLDTSNGSKGEIEARLPKSGVSLAVLTGNPESRLSVQGMKLGPAASYKFGPVERGRYHLVVSAPGMKTIDQTVEVPIKGSAIYRAKLRPKDGSAPSLLAKGRPFYKHWAFYSALGSAVLAGSVAAAMSASGGSTTTQTSPSGDILVSLP